MPREFSDEALRMIAGRFRVLAEPMRLRILNALRESEQTVTKIVEATGAGQANVSKHLGLLRRHRIVERRKDGLHAYYRIADPAIFQLCELVCDALESELDVRRAALTG